MNEGTIFASRRDPVFSHDVDQWQAEDILAEVSGYFLHRGKDGQIGVVREPELRPSHWDLAKAFEAHVDRRWIICRVRLSETN